MYDTTSVAIVDDDVSARTAIQGVVKSIGFNATSFASAEEFLTSDQMCNSACLIADVQLPGMSGLELQKRLAERGLCLPVVFVSAYGDEKTRARALKAGALAFFDKPFNDDALIAIVRTAVEK